MKLAASERYGGYLLHVICSSSTPPTPTPRHQNRTLILFSSISNLESIITILRKDMPMNCIIISTLTRLTPTLIRSCTILVKRDKFKKCRTTLTCFYLHLSTKFTMSLSSVKSNQTCEYISVVRGVQREIKKRT